MTTFVTRKTAREAVAALFRANGTWQTVYDHEPRDLAGESPVLTIRSGGTLTSNMFNASPTAFLFVLTNYVLVTDGATWGPDDAEDKLDELDREIREIVRDNTPAGCDYIELDESASVTAYVEDEGGHIYRTETFTLRAELATGQI